MFVNVRTPDRGGDVTTRTRPAPPCGPRRMIEPGSEQRRTAMYSQNGDRFFVVDGHIHFWDASPENRNRYGEGFIACFYDYHRNLSPPEVVWPKEKYDKYSEQDMIGDLFETGYVDK